MIFCGWPASCTVGSPPDGPLSTRAVADVEDTVIVTPSTLERELRRCVVVNDLRRVQQLLQLGKRQLAVHAHNSKRRTALHLAGLFNRVDAARMLIERGAHINAVDFWGDTPLDLAVWTGSVDTLVLLLEAGARPERRNTVAQRGWTPLHVAAYLDDAGAMAALLAAATAGAYAIKSTGGNTALHVAARFGCVHALNVVLAGIDYDDDEMRNGSFQTPVHSGARGGSGPCVTVLIAAGADAAARDSYGMTPFHTGVKHGATGALAVLAAAAPGCVDSATAAGATPLNTAALHNDGPMVALLLSLGADPRAHNGEPLRRTPLHTAASHDNAAAAGALLTCGGPPLVAPLLLPPLHSAVDAQGRTPLHVGAISRSCAVVALLLAHGASVAARDAEGATPLHCACASSAAEAVGALLDAGADPDAVDEEGRTCWDVCDVALQRAQLMEAKLVVHREGRLLQLAGHAGTGSSGLSTLPVRHAPQYSADSDASGGGEGATLGAGRAPAGDGTAARPSSLTDRRAASGGGGGDVLVSADDAATADGIDVSLLAPLDPEEEALALEMREEACRVAAVVEVLSRKGGKRKKRAVAAAAIDAAAVVTVGLDGVDGVGQAVGGHSLAESVQTFGANGAFATTTSAVAAGNGGTIGVGSAVTQ